MHEYKQEKSLDFKDIFAAIIKLILYKIMMAVKMKKKYTIHYMNVITAFFYEYLDKLIYVKQSHLFITNLFLVYKLKKALYKLKQSAYV